MDKINKKLFKQKKIHDVKLSSLKIISTPGGDVKHGMKISDTGFDGFGEAYFSNIDSKYIKGWKLHRKMTLNIILVVGKIRFVLIDDREFSTTKGCMQVIELSIDNYKRLTIPPLIWMAFQGMDNKTSTLLNIANIPHDQSEVESKEINYFTYDWRKK